MQKVKFFFLCLAVHLLATFTQAQTLIPYRKDTLWGFSDAQKKIVIPLQYKTAFPFQDGKALVVTWQDHLQQVDTSGKVLKQLELSYVQYKHGFIVYEQKDKKGLLDLTGKIILKPIYNNVEILSRERFRVTNQQNREGIINAQLDTLRAFKPAPMLTRLDMMPSCNDKPCLMADFSEDMAPIRYQSKTGYINHRDELVIPYKYDIAESFSGGLARVTRFVPVYPEEYNKPPSYDASGNRVMDAKQAAIDFKEGYINKQGKEFFE
ncbi:MAG: WG repeat-containing protein [Thermonemataceae bacterium]